MRLLAASALWWLLLGAVIIFFYLLKLKRRRQVVSSVLLWQRALEELEANAPFRKLRRNLLLILQLLILAALVFALARPLVTTSALASGNTIIVIDATASMSARDEDGRSRLERAQEIARDMITGLGGNDRAAVIESASTVRVRSPLTADRAALRTAIDEVRQTDTAGTLAVAILLAEQIAKTERDAGIVVIGDGGGAPLASEPPVHTESPLAAPPQTASPSLRFIRVGRRADNVGIVTLNSRPIQSGTGREMFASIANFSDREQHLEAQLRIEGNLVDARTLTIDAAERSGLIFDALPETGGLAELRLVINDDLAADNLAYTFLPDARPLRVGVTSDNPFLLRALAVNPDFDVHRINPGASIADYDCIVSEGPIEAGLIESNRPVLAINPSDIPGLWQSAGEREHPDITGVDRSHPLNSYLNYGDLHIESATRREVAPWLRPVVSGAGEGLIWAGENGQRRFVLIGFDLAKSDLPLKVEFPILLANSVAWLTGRDQSSDERTVRAGQPMIIPAAESAAIITTPSGDEKEIEARDGSIVFAETRQTGIYKVKDRPPFAVNLLSESESDTTPRDSIRTRRGETSGQAETFSAEREIWRWVALAALFILALEWWVYHRRITV